MPSTEIVESIDGSVEAESPAKPIPTGSPDDKLDVESGAALAHHQAARNLKTNDIGRKTY